MGRPAKILAWVIAAILAVFALAAIALTFFFDPNGSSRFFHMFFQPVA